LVQTHENLSSFAKHLRNPSQELLGEHHAIHPSCLRQSSREPLLFLLHENRSANCEKIRQQCFDEIIQAV
jgi:hypothetical protein